MEALNKIYKQRFFQDREKNLSWRAPILAKAVKKIFGPMTAIDVGCAIGDVVKAFNEVGIAGFGLEGSPEAEPFLVCPRSRIVFRDLRKLIKENIGFDFVLSLEVAEHIEPEYAEIYVENLCRLGNQILISAAPPGQKGHYHVNCQPPEYWVEIFKKKGYQRSFAAELMWKKELEEWKNKKEMTAYINNALYFCKG